MEKIFELWLDGVMIILPFLGLGIAMVIVTYMCILMVDLMGCVMGISKDLEIIRFFLPLKVYNVLNKLVK